MPGRIIERNRYYPRIVDFCDNSSCMSCISLSWISYPKIHLKKNYIKMLVWLKKFQAWELSSQNLGLSTGGGLSVTWLGSAQLLPALLSSEPNWVSIPSGLHLVHKVGFQACQKKTTHIISPQLVFPTATLKSYNCNSTIPCTHRSDRNNPNHVTKRIFKFLKLAICGCHLQLQTIK